MRYAPPRRCHRGAFAARRWRRRFLPAVAVCRQRRNQAEHEALLALVDFTYQRTLEKLEAQVARVVPEPLPPRRPAWSSQTPSGGRVQPQRGRRTPTDSPRLTREPSAVHILAWYAGTSMQTFCTPALSCG